MGRRLNIHGRALSDAIRCSSGPLVVSTKLAESAHLLAQCVRSARPVAIGRTVFATWTLFTDGAYEPDNNQPAGVGGVLINPNGQACAVFGGQVPQEILKTLLKDSSHPIYKLELLPVMISLWLWCDLVKASLMVIYIDNEAAKSALIRLDGKGSAARALTELFANLEEQVGFSSWIGRVPSHSNPADGPCRGSFSESCIAGAQRCEVDWPALTSQLLAHCPIFREAA